MTSNREVTDNLVKRLIEGHSQEKALLRRVQQRKSEWRINRA